MSHARAETAREITRKQETGFKLTDTLKHNEEENAEFFPFGKASYIYDAHSKQNIGSVRARL